MEKLYIVWQFIESQILGMEWLSVLITKLLYFFNIDQASNLGKVVHFFIYDCIKIFILLAVLIFIISYLQSYFSPQKTKQILSKYSGLKARIFSALLGTITPFCSCSSIPIFMGFTSARLPIGVTFAFLISSPMVDLASIILLSSIFNFKIAILYIFFGLLLAVIGGSLIEYLKMDRYIEDFIKNMQSTQIDIIEQSKIEKLVYAKEQVIFTIKRVYIYIFIGVLIGALIHGVIPQSFIQSILGQDNPFVVVLSTLCGIPIYADIFGTLPIAQSLLEKGVGLGTVLSFMMAVTTLSLPSIIMLKRALKPQLLSLFVFICVMGIILLGYLFNFLAPFLK
ncbi:permease [Campylobacter hepaticus]